MIPRWLRWLVPFRRRVLHDPHRVDVDRKIEAATKVVIAWDDVSRIVRERVVSKLRDDFAAPNQVFLRLRSAVARPVLLKQIRGWQRVSPHLSSEDSWLAWRAIVGDHRKRCA